ncbi:carbonic anhydrase [Meinhardsimonia xiamenensis]|jgi:carbonic anhydrase|uniref:Carbonic anhydrase n=1 Tax=Meinhardsimonia xiamenensis TaxID=990712 RepID=A0A1G8YIE2_9RHOB|nr:carbonic anhydrase [Meinhardsimonia xiamenensis]PRX37314.1 carbonic anhydrase [Meinhardsimonia xiamenensis]SDK02521.1 carbonic anhydrase [Meinhardsimonia xiamenensis]
MLPVRPLPAYLVQRYHGWKATTFAENRAWYKRLAEEGQRPRAMVITCCDSRVHATSIFGADQGEFFIHRNIANLVPPYAPDGDHHGTSAAVEYAVTALKVAHVIVMGHSRCGGVQGCHDMCSGNAPELEKATSFVGRWMDILRPGYERVAGREGVEDALTELEHEAVRVSLENLMSFPFVAQAVEAGDLTLHGAWHEIGSGELHVLDAETGCFVPV